MSPDERQPLLSSSTPDAPTKPDLSDPQALPKSKRNIILFAIWIVRRSPAPGLNLAHLIARLHLADLDFASRGPFLPSTLFHHAREQGVFLGALDTTIVASLVTDISASFEKSNQSSWLGTSYLLSTATFTPLYGSSI